MKFLRYVKYNKFSSSCLLISFRNDGMTAINGEVGEKEKFFCLNIEKKTTFIDDHSDVELRPHGNGNHDSKKYVSFKGRLLCRVAA